MNRLVATSYQSFMFTPEEQTITEDKIVEAFAETIYLFARQEVRNEYEKSNPGPVSHE